MKNRAKTYRQFINEAYIDDSGELRDFQAPSEDDYDFQIIDQAQRIQEYLEESGADRVRIKVDGGVIEFKFIYLGTAYLLELDLDTNETILSSNEIVIYQDSADSFFDLLGSAGLTFL